MMVYDLVIIGAGPAGITASVYASRKRLNFLIITMDVGGQTAWSGDIENYTGYQFITGPDLAGKFEEHIQKYGVTVRENEEAVEVKKEEGVIRVKTAKGSYEAKTLIVASGKVSRELNVPGEEKFKNRGLSYCATCDGPIFASKDVAVIGGGNSALDAALQLVKIARHVYIVNIAPALSGDAVMREKLEKSDKASILNSAEVTAINGDRAVNEVVIKKEGGPVKLAVQGVFVEIGLIPNSKFIDSVEKNELGEIKVNCKNETSVPGIFAAGDVTDVPEKQIIIAAGEGAKAALSAFRYLNQNR